VAIDKFKNDLKPWQAVIKDDGHVEGHIPVLFFLTVKSI
jgi:hypothetical protein